MRIRRNASKLLGSASAAAYSNPSPAPAASASAAAAEREEEFTVCELNRSPWDVMDINLCNFLANPKEEDGRGILGNFFKTNTSAELTLKEMKEIESKKATRKERKKVCKRKETVVVDTITYCKKSDGKGWHCKRLAQLPSSFCSYHLAQIRSYSASHSHRAADAAAAATGNGTNHQTKSAVAGEAGVDSNFYYYYNGFGPWRSKRRGGGGVDACDKVKEAVKEDMDSKERMVHDDDDDNVVAGEDEYDLDCFDEDDDDDNLYSLPQENEAKGKKEGEIEEKKVLRKRGRKPLKCRSLKSLL